MVSDINEGIERGLRVMNGNLNYISSDESCVISFCEHLSSFIVVVIMIVEIISNIEVINIY